RPERLGEEGQLVDQERQLAQARADQRPRGADLIAEIEVLEDRPRGLGKPVLPDEQLELRPPVMEIEKRRLAMLPDRLHPARHPQPKSQPLEFLRRLAPMRGMDAER